MPLNARLSLIIFLVSCGALDVHPLNKLGGFRQMLFLPSRYPATRSNRAGATEGVNDDAAGSATYAKVKSNQSEFCDDPSKR